MTVLLSLKPSTKNPCRTSCQATELIESCEQGNWFMSSPFQKPLEDVKLRRNPGVEAHRNFVSCGSRIHGHFGIPYLALLKVPFKEPS